MIVNDVLVVASLDVYAMVGYREIHVVDANVHVVDGDTITILLSAVESSVDSAMINYIELFKVVVASDGDDGDITTTAGSTTSASASTDSTTTAETSTSSTDPPVLTRVVGLNCGGTALTDAWGNVWISDEEAASGGTTFNTGVFVDPELYEGDLLSTERYSGLRTSGVTFVVRVAGPGRYLRGFTHPL